MIILFCFRSSEYVAFVQPLVIGLIEAMQEGGLNY